ncbi:MAG: hypothetical protein HY879_23070 [Deltaproteobacteria bacterium]|nr:hypothetical protein [Deltaproteobacteria bacterium]
MISPSEEMSGQAVTMKEFVGQLVSLVGGKKGNGQDDAGQQGLPEEYSEEERRYLEERDGGF